MYYVDKSYPQKRNKKDYHKKDKCCGGINNEININVNSDRGNGDDQENVSLS